MSDERCKECGHTLAEHDEGGWACDCEVCPWKARSWKARALAAEALQSVGHSLAAHAAVGLTAPEPAGMDIARQAYRLGHEGSAGYAPMTVDELDTWISAVWAKAGQR